MDSKLHGIKRIMNKIKADCESLEKKGELTERGRGQLDVVNLIEEVLND